MTNTIHRFKQGEDYIIVDVNSGGVHIVDELVYEMVSCCFDYCMLTLKKDTSTYQTVFNNKVFYLLLS